MSIETFNRTQFENALPTDRNGQPLWKPLGVLEGEFCYIIPVDDKSAIMVRSSVSSGGLSAGCGEDSIRFWLIGADQKPLGSKVSRWTTRVTGWQKRMKDGLRKLWGWRKQAGNCSCGQPMGVFETSSKKLFVKCSKCHPKVTDWKTQVRWIND
jgi:hypothetical protein